MCAMCKDFLIKKFSSFVVLQNFSCRSVCLILNHHHNFFNHQLTNSSRSWAIFFSPDSNLSFNLNRSACRGETLYFSLNVG